ncbi:hypothetical protein B0H14DRAFT_2597645 [Mycena olivaceomarginata]|nr:hypothetical protein B0H14DRAFT_2597645 [Mycena olivaceomarginata]
MPSNGMMRAVDLSRPRDEENTKTIETQDRPARTWSQAGSTLTAALPLPLSARGPTRSSPLSGEHPAPTSPGSSYGHIFVLWPGRIRPHIIASLSACNSTHPSPLSAPGPTHSSPLSARGPACPPSLSTPYPTRSSSLSGNHPLHAPAFSGECPAPTSPGSPHGRTLVLWPARIRPHVFASLSARISTCSSPLSTRGPAYPHPALPLRRRSHIWRPQRPLVFNLRLVAVLELGADFVQTPTNSPPCAHCLIFSASFTWGRGTGRPTLPDLRSPVSFLLPAPPPCSSTPLPTPLPTTPPPVPVEEHTLTLSCTQTRLAAESHTIVSETQKMRVLLCETGAMPKKHWALCVYAVLLTVNSKDKMECIAQCVQATLEVAAVPGVTFDSAVEDTIRRAVHTVLASSPTPLVDSRSRERVRLTLKLVWMGNEETGTSSGSEFPPCIVSEHRLMRISPEMLAPTESVHHDVVGDTQRRDAADEYGTRNIAGRLHAEGDNDSVDLSASAEFRVRAAERERGLNTHQMRMLLAKGAEAVEGTKELFRTVGSRRRDRMLDWNELTQSDDSLGPLPVFEKRGEDESASIRSTYLKSESRRPEIVHTLRRRRQAKRRSSVDPSMSSERSSSSEESCSDEAPTSSSCYEACEMFQSEVHSSGEDESEIGGGTDVIAALGRDFGDRAGGPRQPGRNWLPKDEFDRLKREGRCFKCQEIGRLSSNCLGDQESGNRQARTGVSCTFYRLYRINKDDGQAGPHADNGDEQVEMHADKDAKMWGRMRAGHNTKLRPCGNPGDGVDKNDGQAGPRADNGDERVGPDADNDDGWVELHADKDAMMWGRMRPGQAGCSPNNGDERVGPRADKGYGRLGSRVEKGDEQMGPRAEKGDGQVESSANKDSLHKARRRFAKH